MGVHPSEGVSEAAPTTRAQRPRFVVLVTNGIGGTERRFADIVAAMNAASWQTSLVVPESLRINLLDSSSLAPESVIGIGDAHSDLGGFLRSYTRWLLPHRSQKASFHYPLNCLFPLHARTPHHVTASLTDVRPPRRLPSRDRRQWKYYGILRFSRIIDVLNPDVLLRTSETYPRFAGKLRLTPTGTFVDPSGFGVEEESDPRVVLMGRLIPARKGVEDLLDLAGDLQSRISDLIGRTLPLHIVGTGPLEAYVRERVELLRAAGTDIHYDGFLSGPAALRGASVALSLQPENNYPSRVVAESLLSGASVVIRDTGESRLFGSPPGVSYVPARLTADSLGTAIANALTERARDPDLSTRIRSAAVENYYSSAVPRYLFEIMSPGSDPGSSS